MMLRGTFLCIAALALVVAAPATAHAIGCDTSGCPNLCDECINNICQPKSCNSPGQCFKLPGTCSGGVCTYTVNPGATCNDNNACTKSDTCQANGTCAGTAYSCTIPAAPDGTCWTSTACDGAGGCNSVFKPNTTTCDKDANACTVGDHCDGSGHCLAGPPMQCTTPPNAQCYQPTGTCTAGNCGYTVKSGSCDDGDACTYQDTCQGDGSCKGLAGRSCAATAECPIAGMCDGNGGCTPPADRDTKGNCASKQAGDTCSTCNPCQQGQTCNASGDCVGAPVSDGVSCTTDACPNGMCAAGSCACMSVPKPDLAFPIIMDMSAGVDPGPDPNPNPNPNPGTGSGKSGGCAVGAGGSAPYSPLALFVVGLMAFFVRRGARRARA